MSKAMEESKSSHANFVKQRSDFNNEEPIPQQLLEQRDQKFFQNFGDNNEPIAGLPVNEEPMIHHHGIAAPHGEPVYFG